MELSGQARSDVYEALKKLASDFRCCICLSLIQKAKAPPCYHFACGECWDTLLKTEGIAHKCPICKEALHRRGIKPNNLFHELASKLKQHIGEFGFDLNGSCIVIDPKSPPKPMGPMRFVPITRRLEVASGGGGGRGEGMMTGSHRRPPSTTSSDTNDDVSDDDEEEEEDEEGKDHRPVKRNRCSSEASTSAELERRGGGKQKSGGDGSSSTGSSRLLHEAAELFGSPGPNRQAAPPRPSTIAVAAMASPPSPPRRQRSYPSPSPPPLRLVSAPPAAAAAAAAASSSSSSSSPSRRGVKRGLGCLASGTTAKKVDYAVGDTVKVMPRTWPGINKQGGAGRITAVHGDGTFDVRYVLGGSETNVSARFIEPAEELKANRPTRRSTSSGLSSPVGVLPTLSSPSPPARRQSAAASSLTRSRNPTISPAAGTISHRRSFAGGPRSGHPRKENQSPALVAIPSRRHKSLGGAASTNSISTYGGAAADSHGPRPQDMVILGTALPSTMMSKLEEFASMFKITTVQSPGPDVTHVVCKADRNKKAEQRTLKYLHGLLNRCWVLSSQWITDSLASGKVLNEERYELVGDPKASEPSAPTKARLSREKNLPALFQDYSFAFYGSFPPPRPGRRELEKLLVAGQGTLVHDPRTGFLGHDPSKWFIICNNVPPRDQQSPLPANAGRANGPCLVTSDWLLDTISNYRHQPVDRYEPI